jgi:hypothetical protein
MLILYSIASNIEIIKGKTLLSIFFHYLREFPLRKSTVVIEAQPTSMVILGDKVEATLVRNPKYIEEKIEYLQEQISELKRDLGQKSKERSAKIDSLSKELSGKTQETKSG